MSVLKHTHGVEVSILLFMWCASASSATEVQKAPDNQLLDIKVT
jgi:hypothetical protein